MFPFVPNLPIFISRPSEAAGVHNYMSQILLRTNKWSPENGSFTLLFAQLSVFSSPHPFPSLQVRKTTRRWSGSGFTRARPSAARPVAPTTSWWPTSSPTNLTSAGLLSPHTCATQPCVRSVFCFFSLLLQFPYIPATFRTRRAKAADINDT